MSEKPVKLTKPQADMLREFAAGRTSGAASYPPIAKLLALGLITERPSKFTSSYALTDAGRAHPAATTSGEAP